MVAGLFRPKIILPAAAAEWPDARVWLGAAIIIAAALYVLHRERRARIRG